MTRKPREAFEQHDPTGRAWRDPLFGLEDLMKVARETPSQKAWRLDQGSIVRCQLRRYYKQQREDGKQ